MELLRNAVEGTGRAERTRARDALHMPPHPLYQRLPLVPCEEALPGGPFRWEIMQAPFSVTSVLRVVQPRKGHFAVPSGVALVPEDSIPVYGLAHSLHPGVRRLAKLDPSIWPGTQQHPSHRSPCHRALQPQAAPLTAPSVPRPWPAPRNGSGVGVQGPRFPRGGISLCVSGGAPGVYVARVSHCLCPLLVPMCARADEAFEARACASGEEPAERQSGLFGGHAQGSGEESRQVEEPPRRHDEAAHAAERRSDTGTPLPPPLCDARRCPCRTADRGDSVRVSTVVTLIKTHQLGTPHGPHRLRRKHRSPGRNLDSRVGVATGHPRVVLLNSTTTAREMAL